MISAIIFALSLLFWHHTMYEIGQDGLIDRILNNKDMGAVDAFTRLWGMTAYFKYWVGTAVLFYVFYGA